ncbi:putative transcription factor bHLH041 isoform X2 [Typha angustifolia]|uniref:putative transcription factor bHLH041 isoform X2 n=1 Tax=Typha angustifolia TaxID=59011 RepID=UPI003C2B7003
MDINYQPHNSTSLLYCMDSIFLLNSEARRRFLQNALRILGCAYICLWSPFPHPASNLLASMGGWFHDEEIPQPSSSSSSGISAPRRLFDAYQRSTCSISSGCVPGLAYTEGLPYIEFENSHLLNLASSQLQQQFYQGAGIKIAVFMGCQKGEIELGMRTSANVNMQMNVQQVFSEDFIQQSVFDDLLHLPDQSRPSSSTSSLRSLSVGSPECSSLMNLSKGTASFMPSRYRDMQFTTPETDDAAMATAMLAVISSTPPPSLQLLHDYGTGKDHGNRPPGAFKAYNSALAPKIERRPAAVHGQRMIKTVASILRRMYATSFEARMPEARPTSSQLHHMISERKRREKLNESFHSLRMLLPPGSKKDKASVLAKTKEFVNTLKAQVSELEERNRELEMQLHPPDHPASEAGDSSVRVQVQITSEPASTSDSTRINLTIIVRVECEMIQLLLDVLEFLKGMTTLSLVSVSANTDAPGRNIFARASLTLQVKGSDWDKPSFEEAVRMVVEDAVSRPTTGEP